MYIADTIGINLYTHVMYAYMQIEKCFSTMTIYHPIIIMKNLSTSTIFINDINAGF